MNPPSADLGKGTCFRHQPKNWPHQIVNFAARFLTSKSDGEAP
jgi:hypothetical protein